MATIIKSDGTREAVKGDKPNGTLSLEQMQKAVGGYIELIRVRGEEFGGQEMYVNEDGKMRRLPFNVEATRIAQIGDDIVGDVIIADDGETD